MSITLSHDADCVEAQIFDYFGGRSEESSGDAGARTWLRNAHWTVLDDMPNSRDFVLNEHRLLLAYWHSLPRRGGLRIAEHLDARALGPIMGSLAVLEAEDQGEDFRYRLSGSRIARVLGLELTDRRVSDLDSPAVPWLLEQYRTVIARCRPVYAEHDSAYATAMPTRWSRLLLPVADRNGGDRRVLASVVPIRRRH